MDQWFVFEEFLFFLASVVHFLGEQIGGTVTSLCSITKMFTDTCRTTAFSVAERILCDLSRQIELWLFGEGNTLSILFNANFPIIIQCQFSYFVIILVKKILLLTGNRLKLKSYVLVMTTVAIKISRYFL